MNLWLQEDFDGSDFIIVLLFNVTRKIDVETALYMSHNAASHLYAGASNLHLNVCYVFGLIP